MRTRGIGTRVVQIGILVLLIVSVAQVFWWVLDQSRRTRQLEERLTSLYAEDRRAAAELVRSGTDRAKIENLFPHLTLTAAGDVEVRPEVLEALSRDRARWLNQYAWEGGFFLLVLFASMAVVWRAVRQQSLLRRRHQNFMAAASHELKSPLASLQLSAETLALRELPSERVKELAERMAGDLDRMQDMVTKILDTSRLEERRVDLHPESVDLAVAVGNVARQMETRAASAGIDLDVHVDVDAEAAIRADPAAVETVLRNLVDNALKAVEANGHGGIRISALGDRDAAGVRIEDDGVGFDSKETEQLFDKFYRPGDEMRRGGSGQGLGLYIVKRLVELEGGRVEARSPGPGLGATFDVWWPTAKGSP